MSHMLRHQQLIRSLALTGMAVAALIAPHAASARPVADPQHVLQAKHVLVDLRSPDAATPVVLPQTQQDLRSPDTQVPVQIAPAKVPTNIDLRSPDTQVPVQPTAPKIGSPVAQPTSNGDDFDFGSAAVGAGIALLIALAAAGTMVAVNRRRPHTLAH
jgi:hypothetical protein